VVKGRIRRRIGVFRIEKKWDEDGGGLGFRAELCCGNENGPATSLLVLLVLVLVLAVGGRKKREKRQ